MTGSASPYEHLGGVYATAGAVEVVDAHHGSSANAAGCTFLVTAWSIEAADGPKCYAGRDKAHEALHIDGEGFDGVATEIAATLSFPGVRQAEQKEFMAIIESYRTEVVAVPVTPPPSAPGPGRAARPSRRPPPGLRHPSRPAP